MHTLTLLLAPALFAASVYMALGELIFFTGGEFQSSISKLYLTKIFVSSELVSVLVQTIGKFLRTN